MRKEHLSFIAFDAGSPSYIMITNVHDFEKYSEVSIEEKTELESDLRTKVNKKQFVEVLENLEFFYLQYQRYLNIVDNKEQVAFLVERISKLLKVIGSNFDNWQDLFFNQLKVSDEDKLTATVFALSSIDTTITGRNLFNKVLAAFAKCTKKQLTCFINGLKHCNHPDLIKGLDLVSEFACKKTKEACEQIARDLLPISFI